MRFRMQRHAAIALAALALFAGACRARLPTDTAHHWAVVTQSGMVRQPVPGSPGEFTLHYRFSLEPRRPDLARVSVADITDPEPLVLVQSGRIGGANVWNSEKVPMVPEALPWLYVPGDTLKRFQLVLQTWQGETSVLVQETLYTDEMKRRWRGDGE